MQLQFDDGAHVCHLFQSHEEQMDLASRFLSDGLAGGEYCAFVTADEALDAWCIELQAHGIDVTGERASGFLEIFSGPEYRGAGEFNSIVKARELLRLIKSKRDDFRGLRIVGDAGWALEPQMPVESLCHWEATADLVWQDTNCRAICQYDITRHPPSAIHSALRTHALVICEGRTMQSPFYEARAILANEPHLNSSNANAAEVRAMLMRLRNS